MLKAQFSGTKTTRDSSASTSYQRLTHSEAIPQSPLAIMASLRQEPSGPLLGCPGVIRSAPTSAEACDKSCGLVPTLTSFPSLCYFGVPSTHPILLS